MKRVSLVFISLLFSGCFFSSRFMKPNELTPLQIQSIQTREYEENKTIIFQSILSVFQDLGYIVKIADIKTGFITAKGTASSDFYSKLFGTTSVSEMSATAFVETIASRTRVRLNFVKSCIKSSTYGQTDKSEKSILDVKFYNSVFERISSSIFIRKSTS